MKQFESTTQIYFNQRSVHFQRLDKLHKTNIGHTTAYKPTRAISHRREQNTTSYHVHVRNGGSSIYSPAMGHWNRFSQSTHQALI